MATHHKTSSFSTDSSQNLQDFSKSLATIALFRSKSNQTSLYTEHNTNINTNNSKGNAFLYNQAKNHRRTASNTLVTSGNRAHQRKLSTFTAISQGNRVESNDITKEIGDISREIKKRQHKKKLLMTMMI